MVLYITMTQAQIIAELQFYVLTRVASATGIHKNTLWRIKHGYTKDMKPETHDALQAFFKRRYAK